MNRSSMLARFAACLTLSAVLQAGVAFELRGQESSESGRADEQFHRSLQVFHLPYRDLCGKRHVQAELGLVDNQSERLIELMEEHAEAFEKLTLQLARSQFEATSREQQQSQAEFERQRQQLNEKSVASLNEILLPHQQKRLTEISLQRMIQVQVSSHVFEMFADVVPVNNSGIEGVETRDIRQLHEASKRETETYIVQEQELIQELLANGLMSLDAPLRERVRSEIEDVVLVNSIQKSVFEYQISMIGSWNRQIQESPSPLEDGKQPLIKKVAQIDVSVGPWIGGERGEPLGTVRLYRARVKEAEATRKRSLLAVLVSWQDSQELAELRAESFELDCQLTLLIGLAIEVPALAGKFADIDRPQRDFLHQKVDENLLDHYRRLVESGQLARHQRVNELRSMGLELEAKDVEKSILREYVQWQKTRAEDIFQSVLLPHQAEKVRKYARQIRIQRGQEVGDPFTTLILLFEASDWDEQDRDRAVECLAECRSEFLDRAIEMRHQATERVERAISHQLRDHIQSIIGEPYDYYEEIRAELD